MEKYNSYTTQDFLDDLDFLQYVKYPDSDNVHRWEQWRASNPSNEQAYNEALFYLRNLLKISRIEPSLEFTNALFDDIEIGILRNRKIRYIGLWSSVAAALLFFLGSGWYYQSLIVVETGSGVLKTVILPDSSTVQLNANSSISYHRAWNWMAKRKVYTTGEVLLEVKHTNKDESHIDDKDRFTAYTGDVAIDVLGTKFNLKNRDNQITVSLLNGRISLYNVNTPGQVMILKPGDIVTQGTTGFQELNNNLQKVTNTASWTEKTIVSENLSVADLINEFRYMYGKEIIVKDSLLLKNKIDGRISLKSEESIIYTIANILKASIRFEKDTIFLDPKSETDN